MPAQRIEGYVIVSADGMLANADHVMPDALKFEGDQQFFTAALDRADLIVHGRHSYEDQPNSPRRKRLDPDPDASLRSRPIHPTQGHLVESRRARPSKPPAIAAAGAGTVAIIGGPQVFAMFMDRYDTFWLSQAPRVRLPGGQPCFPGVPAQSPQDILAAHGLRAGKPQILDAAAAVSVTPWRRVAQTST